MVVQPTLRQEILAGTYVITFDLPITLWKKYLNAICPISLRRQEKEPEVKSESA